MDFKRGCGGCTLCCFTHGIKEFKKPGGQWCPHCLVGNGCKIYESRPRSCKKFNCAWLIGFGTSMDRPDMTHVVPQFQELRPIGLILFLFEGQAGALQSAFVRRQSRFNLAAGKPIMHVPLYGGLKCYLPDRKYAKPIYFVWETKRGDRTPIEIIPFLQGRF